MATPPIYSNLVPILTHELGRAFGLPHVDNPVRHALMGSQFSRDALTPTRGYVVAMIAVLDKSVTGSALESLEFVETSGVRPSMG
jgi:hypothetical protein